MGDMGGVYAKDAIERITHIRKVEEIIDFLDSLQENDLSPKKISTLKKSTTLLKNHLEGILNDPYLLRNLLKERSH